MCENNPKYTSLSSSLTSLFPLLSTSTLLNLNLAPSLCLSPLTHPPIWEHIDLGWTLSKILIPSVLVFQSVKQGDNTCDTGLL